MAERADIRSERLARARALLDLHRPEQALEELHQALAIAPDDPALLCHVALALLQLGRNRESAQAAERALAAEPTNEWAHRLRALALSAEAQRSSGTNRRHLGQEAIRSAEEAVRLRPMMPSPHIALAEARVVARDVEGADDAATTAVRLAPEDPTAWTCRSRVALAGRDFEGAREAAEQALRLDPEHYQARNNLGAALLGLGRTRDAAAAFTAAGRVNATSAVVQRNLINTGLRLPRVLTTLVLLVLLLVPAVGVLVFLGAVVAVNRFVFGSARARTWGMARGIRMGERPARSPWGWPVVFVAAGVAAVLLITEGSGTLLLTMPILGVAVVGPITRRERRARATRATVDPAALRPIRPQNSMRTPFLVALVVIAWMMAITFVAVAITPSTNDPRATLVVMAVIGCVVASLLTRALWRRRSALRR
jgi:Tfp pilus assembly protein PilF